MRCGGMGILRVWIRWMVGVEADGGKSGRPSGSMVVISVSVVVALVIGKGADDDGVIVSGAEEVGASVVISTSSSSGRGTVSATSCMNSSGCSRAVGTGISKSHGWFNWFEAWSDTRPI
jgi:hypothetical protein